MARYSPTQKNNILRHSARHQLLDLVKERPGTTTSALRRLLDYSWSTINYHLRQLEAHGYLRSIRSGRRVRFFYRENGQRPEIIALLKQGRALEFAQAVIEAPGSIQKQVSQHLNMSRKVMNGYVKRLTRAGLIHVVRSGGQCQYEPTHVLHHALESLHSASSPSNSEPTQTGLH